MVSRFDREVKPFIDKGFFEVAAGQLEQITKILEPHKGEIQLLIN